SAGADGSDDLAARDDRHAALDRDRAMQRQYRVATTGDRILEDLCRPAEKGGRARLFDGDLDRTELGVVHALEVDQEAAVVDDRDRIRRGTGLRHFSVGRSSRLLG